MGFAKKFMTEKAEKLNGKVAMLGMFAPMGAYYFTFQIVPEFSNKKYFLNFLRALLSSFFG